MPGLVSSATSCKDAQPDVPRSDNPPGPRASMIRSRVVPPSSLRLRWIALVSSASASRSRPAGSLFKRSENESTEADAVLCICPQNRTDSRRVKRYFSAYEAEPPGPPPRALPLEPLIGLVFEEGRHGH